MLLIHAISVSTAQGTEYLVYELSMCHDPIFVKGAHLQSPLTHSWRPDLLLGVLIDLRCKVIPYVAHVINSVLHNHWDVRAHRQSYCGA